MDLGLGNLTQVKTRIVVNNAQVARTTWDAMIAQVARGVAGAIDKFCNRVFARAAATTDLFTADRMCWVMSRFPVESIDTIELRSGLSSDWQDQGAVESVLQDYNPESGLIQFGNTMGSAIDRVRVTYTGGYWYDTTEDGTGTLPQGAATIPADVVEAWLIQCKEAFNTIDPLGLGIGAAATDNDPAKKLTELKLVPQVKSMLAGHVRYQLS